MMGGAWRAKKGSNNKAAWGFTKNWRVFRLPKAVEMGALCQFYLHPQGETN